MKFDGLAWESEATAWRIYFDKRNAIDVWGKRRPGLYLEMFGAPEYVYHQESPLGRDIYRIGDAIGIGISFRPDFGPEPIIAEARLPLLADAILGIDVGTVSGG